MIFIETPIFTREIQKHLSDNELRKLQLTLLLRPESGKVIKGSAGLRKVRCRVRNKGKSGGLRIIYYYDPPDTIYLIFSYAKSEREDLSQEKIKVLAAIVEEYLK